MLYILFINLLYDIGTFVLNGLDTFGFDNSIEMVNTIADLFAYANVLFPFNELLPIGAFYFFWFNLRLGLSLFGFFKKYIPIA